MLEKRIRLITRGDDCGSNKTANQGILESVDKGILKNVSLMACCDAIEDAAAIFARRKDICFGVHTTLNAEWDNVRWGPVLPVNHVLSLVDDRGHFYQTVEALEKNPPKIDEVMAELQAQLNRLRELGFHISYADQHMYFGSAIKDFDKIFDKWCKKEGLLNCSYYYHYLPAAQESANDPVETFILQLEQAKPGQYLVIGHPAYDNEEMRQLGHEGYPAEKVAGGRHWERLMYSDPRIVEYVKNNGVTPIRLDEAIL